MNKSSIGAFWNQYELTESDTHRQKELLKLSNLYREQLESSFNRRQQELFDEYYKNLSGYNEAAEKNAFFSGFFLGTEMNE